MRTIQLDTVRRLPLILHQLIPEGYTKCSVELLILPDGTDLRNLKPRGATVQIWTRVDADPGLMFLNPRMLEHLDPPNVDLILMRPGPTVRYKAQIVVTESLCKRLKLDTPT